MKSAIPSAWRRAALTCAATLIVAGTSHAQSGPGASLSLEDLLQLEVVTASRKSQRLLDVPAAAFVVTRDDIARSGATTLPEALRLVPGVNVARSNTGVWAVSVRGFNGRFANKLQVMIDGRSIYSPLFSGVLWEADEVMLEDVERIEIIRGPGAALWGANAVNGVINVITRKASATQGTLATAAAGAPQERALALRHGLGISDDIDLRVWAKGFDRAHATMPDDHDDAWRGAQTGLRADRSAGGVRQTFDVGAFRSESHYGFIEPLLVSPYARASRERQDYKGGAASWREERVLAGGSQLSWQASVATSRLSLFTIGERRHTGEIGAQHRVSWDADKELVWGLSYRISDDRLRGAYPIEFSDERSTDHLFSVFAQDEWSLAAGRVLVSYGIRVDRATDTGAAFQPNLRLLWKVAQTQRLWASFGRAERLPSRVERSTNSALIVLPPTPTRPLPVEVRVVAPAADELRNESLKAIEVGYRAEWAPTLFFDLTAFANDYSRLRGGREARPLAIATNPTRIVVFGESAWTGEARSRGVELAVDWRMARGLRAQIAAAWLDIDADRSTMNAERERALFGSTPSFTGSFNLGWDITERVQTDLTLRHVGALRLVGIHSYTALDARVAWQLTPSVQVALVGQNLNRSHHAEALPDQLPLVPQEVRRSGYAKLTWAF